MDAAKWKNQGTLGERKDLIRRMNTRHLQRKNSKGTNKTPKDAKYTKGPRTVCRDFGDPSVVACEHSILLYRHFQISETRRDADAALRQEILYDKCGLKHFCCN